MDAAAPRPAGRSRCGAPGARQCRVVLWCGLAAVDVAAGRRGRGARAVRGRAGGLDGGARGRPRLGGPQPGLPGRLGGHRRAGRHDRLRGRDDRPLERAAVALAGPAASAALVLALVGVATLERTVEMGTVEFVIALNALAVVVNLVPVGRTDGALLVRGLFRHARSRRRGPEG